MVLRVAVLTDTLSPGFFFPVWCSYYGKLFGRSNLHVLTYEGGPVIQDSTLGSVIRLPIPWDDNTRAERFADLTAFMLGAYDVVIRTDTDEFLAVDPAVAPDLRTYLETTKRPYCTARGFDVTQTMGEAPLKQGPLLAQRNLAYPNSALNKTCIVRMPIRWSPGFHWCTAAPEFGPVFLLHLKRIDVEVQLRWQDEILRHIANNPKIPQHTRDHYGFDRIKILEYNLGVSMRPRLKGQDAWYRHDFQRLFRDAVALDLRSGMYAGSFGHEEVLCEVPEAWRALV